MDTTNPYPEHQKLSEVEDRYFNIDQSETCAEFLEWLVNDSGLFVCESVGPARFGDEFILKQETNVQVLARYFNIDLKKIDREKRQILDKVDP